MVITKLSAILCGLLNKINPKSEEDNIAIRYGFELVLDNVVKLFFLQILGVFLGKGWETFIILFTFCLLRLQAGGAHASSNIGCSLGMFLVWGLSLIGSIFVKLRVPHVIFIYIISFIIIFCFAPRSKNIDYFAESSKRKKKLTAILILTLITVIAVINTDLRELLMYPVTLEVLTLLPKNKTALKGE